MSAPGYCAEDVRVRQAMSTRKSDPAIAAATGWSGRFSEPVAESSSATPRRSTSKTTRRRRHRRLARARALAAVGVLSAADLAAIERGLTAIADEIGRGAFPVTGL
jgi:argininosuccinate lyase